MASGATDVPEELVRAAKAGDRDGVERLLAMVQPRVVRYCRARLGPPNQLPSADDVAQEVCLAVLRGLPGYRLEGKAFMAFVHGVAAHKVIDAHRASTRHRQHDEVPDVEDTSEGPEQHALRTDLSSELRRLLDELPEAQREIIVLRVALGMSATETAATVGSSPGAVRVAQHRGLARLRRALVAAGGLEDRPRDRGGIMSGPHAPVAGPPRPAAARRRLGPRARRVALIVHIVCAGS